MYPETQPEPNFHSQYVYVFYKGPNDIKTGRHKRDRCRLLTGLSAPSTQSVTEAALRRPRYLTALGHLFSIGSTMLTILGKVGLALRGTNTPWLGAGRTN